MNRTILIFLFTGSIISVNAQTLTKELLVKQPLYYSGEPMFGYGLEFKNDNTYVLTFGVEGEPWEDSGTFEIQNGEVRFTLVKGETSKEQLNPGYDNGMGNAVGRLINKPTDLYHTTYLEITTTQRKSLLGFNDECQCIQFPVPAFKVKEGSERTVNGIKVITVGEKHAVTTSNVKIRDKPSKTGKAITYFEYYSDLGDSPFVPNQTSLVAIARTAAKEKIDKYEDYWYYVNVGAKEGVWMYGAFIKFQ